MSDSIGVNVRRADGDDKVRGRTTFGMDYAESRMLHGRILRSPVAAGIIRRLDVSRAASMPGVAAVAVGADAPHRSGWFLKDQQLMASTEITYVGEPIAAIAAETFAQAEAAIAAIELEIDPITPILTMTEALAEGARQIHPGLDGYGAFMSAPRYGNVAWEARIDRGDVDAAFAAADHIVEDDFEVGRQHQSPIEPHVAVATYENGRCVVHAPAQHPFLVRDRCAEFLGIRPSQIRVISTPIGGGFGGKLDATLEPFACILARKSGRPVRLINTRQEELQTAGPREGATLHLRTAMASDGTILAQEALVLCDNGAASGETVACSSIPLLTFGSVYRIPTVRYVCKVVYTNTTPTAAFRGVNGIYAVFAQEQHLDHIARQLGMDRRALRLHNVVRAGESIVNGQVLDDAALDDALELVNEIRPWAEATAERRPLRGVGIAMATWLTNPGPGGATVKVNEDGTIGVISGGAEIGTGAMATGVRQIVATELGVPVDDVIVLPPDTDAATFDNGAQGSRTTFAVGNAARKAAATVKRELLEVAASMLEAAADDLEIADGMVGVRGSPDGRVPLSAVAQTAVWTRGPISASDKHAPVSVPFDASCLVGAGFTAFAGATYHAHQAEVEVDPDTGKITILRYVVAQDVGRAINPQQIEGQIHGGVLQGIGYALYEHLRIVDGVVVDDDLEHYRLPTAMDAPPIDIAIFERPSAIGPFGAKGVAEPSILLPAAVIASAVSDAIGRPITRLPITPFDVLAALRERSDAAMGTPVAPRPATPLDPSVR